ncbi:MAG: sensor histidine kinase [Ktedonobacteraceae bacterium]
MLSTTRPTYRCRRGTSVPDGSSLSSPEQFLRMANHELRSPLTAVRVQSQLGRRYLERGDARRAEASLRTIEEQSFHMEHLLRDLLDAAKIPQGRFTVQPEPANLVQLCEQSIATQRAMTGRDIVTHLPSASIPIMADPDALQRLFGHLLLNAALYSPANSPIEVELTVTAVGTIAIAATAATAASAKPPPRQALISVQDEGSGIAAEELSTIFELFYRGCAGYEAETAGLGLGLALCKEIAHLHGGEVWVTSQRPGGSTFFVMLPLE